jgi:hypothetical protein
MGRQRARPGEARDPSTGARPAGPGVERFPLRLLTIGELLDAAINLLRRNALGLLALGAGLAAIEQLLLYPLRRAAAMTPPWYFPPYLDRLGWYWLLLAAGLGTEAAAIALLGGQAARAAVADLADVPPRRIGAQLVLALVTGVGAALTAAAAWLPWIFWFMFTGLGPPALAVDRRAVPTRPTGPGQPAGLGQPAGPGAVRLLAIGPLAAFGRGMALVARGGWRPGGIRLLGYLAWWTIRLALGVGTIALLSLAVDVHNSGWAYLASGVAWAIVNAVAYAALGCLDAVVHLENRMRVEGLDIAVTRALRRGEPAELALAVP